MQMGRRGRFPPERILAAARGIVAENGPPGLTVAVLSQRLGAPVGSIYHRYQSREVLLADLWLTAIESFQPEFLRNLQGKNTIEAGVAAVGFACRWVRRHPQEARLLLLYRRADFIRGSWPDQYQSRAERLRREGAAGIRAYCRRLHGDANARHLRRVRFALVDLPLAAFRPCIEERARMPDDLEPLVQSTTRHILASGLN